MEWAGTAAAGVAAAVGNNSLCLRSGLGSNTGGSTLMLLVRDSTEADALSFENDESTYTPILGVPRMTVNLSGPVHLHLPPLRKSV
ncbi:MAG: hypothetical protein Ct9H90mP14_1230 [Methanobacteriota archaeon]|nr:MAG: hypothetical protein Ct9H90mP14_1230 [Euryarchaeota archaeon]